MISFVKCLKHYAGNGTFINFAEDNSLMFLTKDKILIKTLRKFRAGQIPDYKRFYIKKDNNEEYIDFIYGTKWPTYLHEFMSQVVQVLSK